jgi:hypothetical protein
VNGSNILCRTRALNVVSARPIGSLNAWLVWMPQLQRQLADESDEDDEDEEDDE